jgi:hypothetical protein
MWGFVFVLAFALGDVTPWLDPVSWMEFNDSLRMGVTPWSAVSVAAVPVR